MPKKYAGLDGTEIAISESQERMAVVVDPKDADAFMAYASEENLEATRAAVVTEEPRLVLCWRGKEIVNLSRAFLDTNGAHQETAVAVDIPDRKDTVLTRQEVKDVKEQWMNTLKDLNVCSQKGLVEMFDGSIGAGSVFPMAHCIGGSRNLFVVYGNNMDSPAHCQKSPRGTALLGYQSDSSNGEGSAAYVWLFQGIHPSDSGISPVHSGQYVGSCHDSQSFWLSAAFWYADCGRFAVAAEKFLDRPD